MIIKDENGGITTVDEAFLHHGWPCVPGTFPHNCEEAREKRAQRRGVITLRPAQQEKESDGRHS